MGALSESLITDEVVDATIVVAGEQLPPFSALGLQIKDQPLMIKESAVAAYIAEKSGTRPTVATIDQETDTVDFQSSAGTNDVATVQTKYHWASQDITYAQQLAGIPFETAIPTMMQALREKVWDEAQAIVTTAAYGAAGTAGDGAYSATVANGALTPAILQAMWGECSNLPASANLITTRQNYANILPDTLESFQLREDSPGNGFGLTGRFYYVDDMSGGDAETHTWLLDPNGLVGCWGVPAQSPAVNQAVGIEQRTIVDPMTGLPVLLSAWVDPQSKSIWYSGGVVCGFGVGDNTVLLRASTDHA